jgi:type III secretion system low calcium response chaperone LcrH/SycD
MKTDTLDSFDSDYLDQVIEGVTASFCATQSLGTFYEITDEEYEVLYRKAYQAYNNGLFNDALKLFGLAVYFNASETRFLFGFAATLQMLKIYDKAIFYYMLAAKQDLDDPEITFHLAECLLAQSMQEEAIEALKMTVQETNARPQYAQLHQKAQAYLVLAQKKQSPATA